MTGKSLAAHPQPRGVSTRGIGIGLAVFLVFAVVYGLVVRAYQVEGDLSSTIASTQEEFDVLIIAKPVEFDARTNTFTVRFEFDATGTSLIDDGNRLVQGVRVTVYGADGSHEVRFAAGEPIGRAEFDIGTTGDVYAYPLDTHDGFMTTVVETFERGANGVNETTGTIPASFDIDGGVSGWDIRADISEQSDVPTFFELKRAFSTKAFALVLVGMAATVAVLAFIAAVLTVTNRRRFEVALLTWNGALLFALPLLRNYLPGSPPIGAALDIYLYLWVFVIAVSSSVFMVVAWSSQRKADLLEERSAMRAT